MDDGGNGSGVGVIVALVAPGDREVDDGVQHGETETMARRRVRFRPGAAARDYRRCGGGRRAPVVDGSVEGLQGKIAEDVKEVHTDKGRRMVASGRSRGGSPDGKRRETAAAMVFSGEKILRPGGEIRTGGRGEMRRQIGRAHV